MARARNIKPGFFTNEELVELPFEVRILFAGLWTLADREGRLEDRPKKIKMNVFPADDVDVDGSLELLARKGLIQRYLAGGQRYIQVINFAKHQNPHQNEKASTIPAPEEHQSGTGVIGLIPDSLSSDSPLPAPAGQPRPPKPISLPNKIESEVTTWLDSIARIVGAKDNRDLAHYSRWREVAEKCVRAERLMPAFLTVVREEFERNKGTPQFFTPDATLKVFQARQAPKPEPIKNKSARDFAREAREQMAQ